MQTINEVMTRGVRTLSPTDTVIAAAQAMRELDVGCIPICDGIRLVGMVTDRDIVVRCVAQERMDVLLQKVMSEDLLYCHEQDTVQSAMASMRTHQVRRLVVVDADQRLVGIVSLGDVATKCAASVEDDVGAAVRAISEPSQPHRSGQSA